MRYNPDSIFPARSNGVCQHSWSLWKRTGYGGTCSFHFAGRPPHAKRDRRRNSKNRSHTLSRRVRRQNLHSDGTYRIRWAAPLIETALRTRMTETPQPFSPQASSVVGEMIPVFCNGFKEGCVEWCRNHFPPHRTCPLGQPHPIESFRCFHSGKGVNSAAALLARNLGLWAVELAPGRGIG